MFGSLADKFDRSRNSLLLVVIFSAVNLVLAVFDSGIRLLYSATIPEELFWLGQEFSYETSNPVFVVLGIVLALAVILFYLACWHFSERKRVLIVVALVAFSLDTIVLFYNLFTYEPDVSFLIDVAFQGWIMFSLITGAMAWSKLRTTNKNKYDESALIKPNCNGYWHSAAC
jgi:cbb3-type cytochrome oxidase subunit 3